MAVVASGPVSLPIYLLRRMISLSPTFQALVGASTAAQALGHIYCKDVEGTERRPCVVLWPDGGSFDLIAGGMQNQLRGRGQLWMWLAMDTHEDDFNDNTAAMFRFGNLHGNIGQEIADLSAADQTADTAVPGSHLQITTMTDEGIAETDETEWEAGIGRYWAGVWRINWGDS